MPYAAGLVQSSGPPKTDHVITHSTPNARMIATYAFAFHESRIFQTMNAGTAAQMQSVTMHRAPKKYAVFVMMAGEPHFPLIFGSHAAATG